MARRTVAGKPLEHLPAIMDMMRDRHPLVVLQKSAQVGATEMMVNLALHAADTGYAERGNVLFLMPTANQMEDFAQGRFDRALQDSPYLRSRLQPEPPRRKAADNKRVKRVGPGYVYLRGTESRRQVASVDADLVLLDEFDQMAEGILDLAVKRIASSRDGRLFVASTPRLPEAGINALYLESDQRSYHLPCPACRFTQALSWPDNVDTERALVVCGRCREPMDVRAKGEWRPGAPGNSRIHGYRLNRLYSPWANIRQLIEASGASTPFAMQEFYNSDLGEPFVPPGGGITVETLDRCRADYHLEKYTGHPCAMGIDVGINCHVVIRERSDRDRPDSRRRRLWFAGEVPSAGLDDLVQRFNVQSAIIDRAPEHTMATEFARRHGRKVALAMYTRHEPGHERRSPSAEQPALYHINRTEGLDEMYHLFSNKVVELPRDARTLGGKVRDGIGEYYRELLALKRTLERDATGNLAARWVDGGRDDHFAHAELYCMLADKRRGGRILRVIRF